MEGKVSNFKNHQRFLLRCLDKGLVPVSLRLKNLIRTRRGKGIIYKAEKQLLNERIRNINYILECYEHERYMYQSELKELIDQEMWNACIGEIGRRKELRHRRVMERQISKFNRLLIEKNYEDQGGCSNHWSGHSNQHGPEMNNSTPKKWVINLSSIPLTQEQEYLLAHGPNFAVTPQKPPYGEYITCIESACQSLDSNTEEELRSDIYRVLQQSHQLKPNLKKEEIKAIKQLKADKDHMVLTTYKGVALVVMDKSDYNRKAKELLEDTNTYRTIQFDPTNRLKNKPINMLRKLKADTGMQENTYRKMYPTGTSSPKFYGLPKIHKKNIPLRPIVSSIGFVKYGVAKELARIIKPLMGNSQHHVHKTKQFADEIRKIKLEEEECITSYDVTALFTSIPVASSLEIMRSKLEQDAHLPNRSIMTADNIIELLGFCLNNTYFVFQDVVYEQTKGAAMGSPISPIVANIYMEAFENRVISTALHPLGYGRGMLMISLCYNTIHTKKSSSITSTQWILPSNSLLRKLKKMVPYPS